MGAAISGRATAGGSARQDMSRQPCLTVPMSQCRGPPLTPVSARHGMCRQPCTRGGRASGVWPCMCHCAAESTCSQYLAAAAAGVAAFLSILRETRGHPTAGAWPPDWAPTPGVTRLRAAGCPPWLSRSLASASGIVRQGLLRVLPRTAGSSRWPASARTQGQDRGPLDATDAAPL